MLPLLSLLAVVVFSLLLVSYINHIQEKRNEKRLKVRSLKMRVSELEELAISISTLIETPMIAKLINDEAISLLKDIRETDPKLAYIASSLQAAEIRSSKLIDVDSDDIAINRVMQSDAQIARAKKALEASGGALRSLFNKGDISRQELETFLHELSWQRLQVETLSLVAQGHRCMQRQDVLKAYTFYKKAQQHLISHQHSDSRRHDQIKQLTEMLSNQRTTLTTDLMPETQYNPPQREQIKPPSAEELEEAMAQGEAEMPSAEDFLSQN